MTIKPSVALFIFALIVAIPLFAHLNSLPLAEWDESHLAGNALEMNYNHNWIVTMNNGSPDVWQTKPPLMIWLQVIAMKAFGLGELAGRMPSALAALGICLMLFFFFTKKYKEPLLALISVGVLVTSSGFMLFHGARNGEYDVLLTLFTTGYSLLYFLYLEEGSGKYIYGFFALLILAALTKGIQSLLFLPGLALYTVYKKKLITLLRQKELYIGAAMFLFFICGYYLLRERYNPGYIATVWQNELGGRYTAVIEGHDGYPLIYYDWLKTLFSHWYLWVLPGILYGVCSSKKWLKDFTVFTALVCAIYFLILSCSHTAICWYAIPAYPFLSVFAALFICTIFTALCNTEKKFPHTMLPFVFLAVIFFTPYTIMKDTVLSPRVGSGVLAEAQNMELLLQDVLHNNVNINGYSIADLRNDQQLGWYRNVLSYQHRPLLLQDHNDLAPNSRVLAFRPESKRFIIDHFNTRIIHVYYDSVIAYELVDRK